jgi:hypothetical protein
VKPLDPISQAIFDSMREVLSSHGLVICSASDTQYPKLDGALDKVLRECARNSAQTVLAVQDEALCAPVEVGGCSCGAKFYDTAAVDDHECPLEQERAA